MCQIFLCLIIAQGEQFNRCGLSIGSEYSKNVVVEHAGMLWQTSADIAGGANISQKGPNRAVLDSNQININPWIEKFL